MRLLTGAGMLPPVVISVCFDQRQPCPTSGSYGQNTAAGILAKVAR